MLLGWGLSWQLCQLSFLSSLRASFFEASAGNASDSALHISSALLQLRTGLSGEEWRLCMYFRLIYLTTWVPSGDWPETLALQAVKFLVPCGKVNTVWPEVLVLCVGSNCILPCKGALSSAWLLDGLSEGWGNNSFDCLLFCLSYGVTMWVWGKPCSLRVCHCTPHELLQSGLCLVADPQSPVSLGSEQIIMSTYYTSHRAEYLTSVSIIQDFPTPQLFKPTDTLQE